MANTDRTLIIVKPDAIQRGLMGEVISRLEKRGLKFVALKMIQMDEGLANRHYEALKDKPFFPSLIEFITKSAVVVGVVEGPNAFQTVRDTMGATDPLKAAPGTIRFDYGISLGRNIIHGSDSAESAEREINLFFRPDEIVAWERANNWWVVEE
jgi:nucleoside-diphosphate kinase